MKTIGIAAHVDAGKTTLSEAVLYRTGVIRKTGDFLDTDVTERARGITIYSRQAQFEYDNCSFTLIDTPGHADFSPETQRALSLPDAVILVINGNDGVQTGTLTLWEVLERLGKPVFVFINKMDATPYDKAYLLKNAQEKLDGRIVAFDDEKEELWENAALCDEELMNELLENGSVDDGSIKKAVMERKLFPCIFGSAKKQDGIEKLLGTLCVYLDDAVYPEEFGAYVWKISYDERKEKIAFLKITGGELKVRSVIDGEKINQIRIYNGAKYTAVDKAGSGSVVAVTGLSGAYIGKCYGSYTGQLDTNIGERTLKAEFTDGTDDIKAMAVLRRIAEEEPSIMPELTEFGPIVHLMGDVQIQILTAQIWDKFKKTVRFVVPVLEVTEEELVEEEEIPEEEETEDSSVFTGKPATDEELMAIFERTYGKIDREERMKVRRVSEASSKPHKVKVYTGPEYILIDGYNVIFDWDDLKNMAKDSPDTARKLLVNRIANWSGMKKNSRVIIVFDAYKVKGVVRETEQVGNLTVIYTKEAETADTYIEKASYELAKEHRVRVITSDYAEQMIISGNGAFRTSAREFEKEVEETEAYIRDKFIR